MTYQFLSSPLKRKLEIKSAAFYLLAAVAFLLVLSIYLWYFKTSVRRADNNYYSQLALSFKNGQLYLQEKPSPALLALSNPYDYQARKGIAFPWDASLYNDKFYLYWGPIPALLLTILDAKLLSSLGDQHLTFLFTAGLFIYLFIFAFAIWKRFFLKLPAWIFLLAAITMGLAVPFTWILSTPRIYEASISSGQFFFIGGCYWAYSTVASSSSRTWKLIFTGAHWACAIGSRITLAPAIGFLIIMVLIKIAKEDWSSILSKKVIFMASALILPVAIISLGLALYNWARFGSIFEFGVRYQLTFSDYSSSKNTFFSTSYIAENLSIYLIHAFTITSNFPYLKAAENAGTNERMVGLLFTVPYCLLAFLAPIPLIRKPIETIDDPKSGDQPGLWSWLIFSMVGITTINFALLFVYYFAAMRFLVDATPSLLLLSTICFWRGYQAIRSVIARSLFAALCSLLAFVSIINSTLFTIAISGDRLLAITKAMKSISIIFK